MVQLHAALGAATKAVGNAAPSMSARAQFSRKVAKVAAKNLCKPPTLLQTSLLRTLAAQMTTFPSHLRTT